MKFSFEGSIDELNVLLMNYARQKDIVVSSPASTFLPQPPSEIIVAEKVPALAEMSFAPLEGAKANFWQDIPAMPKDDDPYAKRAPMVLPQIDPELRKEAWQVFMKFCGTWILGFDDLTVSQPDRLALMQDLGHGRYTIPVLIMAYEMKSLQRLVQYALKEVTGNLYDLDFIDQVACNMVQISHMGYPDLSGTYDYSTAWKRNVPKELS